MMNSDNFRKVEKFLEDLDKKIAIQIGMQQANFQALTQLKDLILNFQTVQLQSMHSNPLNKFGRKCFSQTDEDGITIEIVKRLGIDGGVYAEFGVGNGLENNTLILASMDWRGFWVGGESLAFNYTPTKKFRYIKDWITLSNIVSHAEFGLKSIDAGEVDVISLDLDGNDIYFVEKLLSKNLRPKLFIVEYNAKFIPPARFQIQYSESHTWCGDDYFGAALVNFVELFEAYSYKLICCNAHTGANAFFIRSEYAELFPEVPDSIGEIYTSPRYHLYSNFGHKISARVVEDIINR